MTTDNTNTTRNDSLAARTDTWLQSLLVWSPGQRDIIKTVALVLMVPGPCKPHSASGPVVDVSGPGVGAAFRCLPLVWGAESVPSCAHIRQGGH